MATYNPKLKIDKEAFNFIQANIERLLLDNPNAISLYESGNIQRADKVKCLQTRFNWDCLRASCGSEYITTLYDKGLKDNHISSALNLICPKVERKY